MATANPCRQSKKEMIATNRHHIPAEIVEEILLNLPVKSLIRFSCVSKSWKSMILDPGFVKRYGSRERMVIGPHWHLGLDIISCPLSSISESEHPTEKTTPIFCPFKRSPYLHASCNGLWCVQVEKSLFLWNPSINTYRKLPNPPLQPSLGAYPYDFTYGLGYDAVADVYKILRLPSKNHPPIGELYSLKSGSWKKLEPFPRAAYINRDRKGGLFAGGALHWTVDLYNYADSTSPFVIISFDLSTEKYREVAQPQYSPAPDYVEVTALKGMLCVCVNYCRNRFVLWVMKDYGDGKSWTKMFDFNFHNAVPYFSDEYRAGAKPAIRLTPLHLYDNGEILIRVSKRRMFHLGIFIYKDEKTIPKKTVDGFMFVESLVSPAAMWPTTIVPPQ